MTSNMEPDSAGSITITMDMNEFLDPVTYDPFDTEDNVPLTLPCGHSVTKKTLEFIKKENNRCPVCRENFGNDFNPKKNVLLANILRSKKKLYFCHVHKNLFGRYICLNEMVIFCEKCLLDDSHSSHNKVTIEEFFQGEDIDPELLSNKLNSLSTIIIGKRKFADTQFSVIKEKISQTIVDTYKENDRKLVKDLINWRKQGYQVLNKYESYKQGIVSQDFKKEEIKESLQECQNIETEFEECLKSSLDNIFKNFEDIAKMERAKFLGLVNSIDCRRQTIRFFGCRD